MTVANDEEIIAEKLKAVALSKCTSSPALLHQSKESEKEEEKQEKELRKISLAASAHKLNVPESPPSTKYRLYAVVYHQGGTERGHYTARCRLPSNPSDSEKAHWFTFDDEK